MDTLPSTESFVISDGVSSITDPASAHLTSSSCDPANEGFALTSSHNSSVSAPSDFNAYTCQGLLSNTTGIVPGYTAVSTNTTTYYGVPSNVLATPSITSDVLSAASLDPTSTGGGGVYLMSPATQCLDPTSSVAAAAASAAAAAAAAAAAMYQTANGASEIIKRCHLHSKPQLTCKFCRKYKSTVHQQARLAQQQEAFRPTIDTDSWAIVEMTNITTYNVNSLLRENILSSEYFKSLYGFKSFHEIVDEIVNYADHAEPYCAGNSRAPSTLFCCLYKLFTMRLKQHELQALLDNTDSPYVRCVGFLYLRYVLPPDKLWDWISPYLLDDDAFSPSVDKTHTTTIGEYVESLMTEDRYYSTVLPRIPVKLKSQYGAQLISMASHRRRRAQNKAHLDQFKTGVPVAACANGEWIEGILLSVEDADTGQAACQIQIGDDDDQLELVDLGLVIILDAKIRHSKRREERINRRIAMGLPPLVKRKKWQATSNSKDAEASKPSSKADRGSRSLSRSLSKGRRHHRDSSSDRHHDKRRYNSSRSRSRERCTSRSPRGKRHSDHHHSSRHTRKETDITVRGTSVPRTEQDMMKEFRRREQAKVLASGRDYARRPTSYKSSLSLKFEGTSIRRRGRTPPPTIRTVTVDLSTNKPSTVIPSEPQVTEPSLAYQRKMAQLVERYSKPALS